MPEDASSKIPMELLKCSHENLYASKRSETFTYRWQGPSEREQRIIDSTLLELRSALTRMKGGKCSNQSGVIAEMRKCGSSCFREAVLGMFNEVLKPDKEPPNTWRQTKLVVLLKKEMLWM